MKKNFAPLAALFALLVFCSAVSPVFRSPGNLMNIATQVSFGGLLALGMTLCIAGGGIDLSCGSLLALSGVLSLQALNALPTWFSPQASFAVMAAVSVAVGLLGGAVNGLLVNYCRIPPFIATLGTFSIYRSLAVYRADAGLVQSSNAILNNLAVSFGGFLPFAALLLFGLFFALVLRSTSFGLRLAAVGSNESAARYASINVRLVRFFSYLAIGALAGVSAVLLCGRLQSVSSTGAGNAYELDAIAAVIIGGTPMSGGKGSVAGTLCGVFILGIIANALDLWEISANLQGAVKGLIIILAVLMQYKRKGA